MLNNINKNAYSIIQRLDLMNLFLNSLNEKQLYML
jgi:hypothetical protein